jgi:hypothetical protein
MPPKRSEQLSVKGRIPDTVRRSGKLPDRGGHVLSVLLGVKSRQMINHAPIAAQEGGYDMGSEGSIGKRTG